MISLVSGLPDELPKIFGWLAVWIGVATGVMNALDWLLSESQKKKLTDTLIKYWYWLDEVRDFRRLKNFQKSDVQLKIIGWIVIIYVILLYIFYKSLDLPGFIAFVFAIGAISAAYFIRNFRYGIEWMTRPTSVYMYAIRSSIVLFTSAAVPILILTVIVIIGNVLTFSPDEFFPFRSPLAGEMTFDIIKSFLIGFVGAFCTLIAYFWSISVIYVTFITFLVAISSILRLILVRTAEYPKGPVLALSTLLATLGAVLTQFASK